MHMLHEVPTEEDWIADVFDPKFPSAHRPPRLSRVTLSASAAPSRLCAATAPSAA
jgi:hypothetical protein